MKWNTTKARSEAERFEAFRSLPQAERLKPLAYCVALTLQPKLAPADGDDATAYDLALSSTGRSVAAYWSPGKDFLGRLTRDQLLAIARDTLGEAWAQPFAKAIMVAATRGNLRQVCRGQGCFTDQRCP